MVVPRRPRRVAGPSSEPSYTGPVEDYLKAIYELERATGSAATNDVARRLGIAPPLVSWMVRRLARQGLLEYERYHGARLTPSGQRAALRILRRHRVIETYLARMLHYPWDEVHAEAERLEHAVSDQLVDRMAIALGEPTVDPHGAPIPTRDGTVAERPFAESIADLSPGDRARVVGVSDDDPARLRYLAELGLVPGAAFVVVGQAPFEGPITLRVGPPENETEQSIGLGLAGAVLVEPVLPHPRRRPRPSGSRRRPPVGS